MKASHVNVTIKYFNSHTSFSWRAMLALFCRLVQGCRLYPVWPALWGGACHTEAEWDDTRGCHWAHHSEVRQLAQLQQERPAHAGPGPLPVPDTTLPGAHTPPLLREIQVSHTYSIHHLIDYCTEDRKLMACWNVPASVVKCWLSYFVFCLCDLMPIFNTDYILLWWSVLEPVSKVHQY